MPYENMNRVYSGIVYILFLILFTVLPIFSCILISHSIKLLVFYFITNNILPFLKFKYTPLKLLIPALLCAFILCLIYLSVIIIFEIVVNITTRNLGIRIGYFKRLIVVRGKNFASVLGGFLLNFIFITEDLFKVVSPLRDYLFIHEMTHVRGFHAGILLIHALLFIAFATAFGEFSLYCVNIHYIGKETLMITLPSIIGILVAFAIEFFIIRRIIELHTDFTVYKKLGSKAFDLHKEFLERMGIKDFEHVPLISRILHPKLRYITLKQGDAIAPLNPLEISIPLSLISSGLVTSYIAWNLKIYNVTFILTSFLLSLTSLIIIILLLGLIVKPILRIILKNTNLTSKGIYNLGILITSIHLTFISLAFNFIIDLPLIAVIVPITGFIICFIISLYYLMGNARKALLTTITIIGIIIGVNLIIILLTPLRATILGM